MQILGKGSLVIALFPLLLAACGDRLVSPDDAEAPGTCVNASPLGSTGSDGSGLVFWPDPLVTSQATYLNPSSPDLDSFRRSMPLERLSGRGVLLGRFVDVRNGLSCDEGYGAFSENNEFNFSQRDERFQETMAYFAGDRFREMLNSAGYLDASEPMRIVSPCPIADNAYYARGRDASGRIREKVCLGISLSTPGASYADDASVTAHELQHGATANAYSVTQELNVFHYDEAGALNEAVSDFMALVFTAPAVDEKSDPRLFGRWALATFVPGRSAARGAHKCPAYDPDFPRCSGFPKISSSALSYVYPDGLGWPFPKSAATSGGMRSTLSANRSQEEIHDNAVILEGALWDAYEEIRRIRDASTAQRLMVRGVMETIKHLPKGTFADLSPVTFRGFARTLIDFAPSVGFSGDELSTLKEALSARGLVGGPQLEDKEWASADPDAPVRIVDSPNRLRTWLHMLSAEMELVTQNTGDSQLTPGDLATVWFNVRNSSDLTAGGVLLKIKSLSPHVVLMDNRINAGAVSTAEAQIRYSKINGTRISSLLGDPSGNSYFKTNPFFDQGPMTAVWIKVSANAPRGSKAEFEVTAVPSNGVASTTVFQAMIH